MFTRSARHLSVLIRASAVAAAALLGVSLAQAQSPSAHHAHLAAQQLMQRDLVGVPGKQVTLTAIEVPPGVSSAPHKHEAQVFVYVVQGHMIMQVRGGPRLTLGPGQTFYENPTDIHSVSANASKTEPAKFLAFVIKDKDKPGLIPVPRNQADAEDQAQPSASPDEASAAAAPQKTGPVLMTRDVIGAPGRQVVMAVVAQRPGARGKPHRHNAQVFVYVLQGKVIMQVKGGPRETLGVGQTFYENPSDIHTVSDNASATEPAKFLAILIKDKDKPITSPVPAE